MKDFLLTFKFLLKQGLSLNSILYKIKTDRKHRNMTLAVILLFILCIPSYVVFITMFIQLFKAYQMINAQSLFIVMAIIFSLFIIFFFGMFQFISYFYFSNDVKLLAPLPIKPSYYLVSKFFVIYLWELLTLLITVLPFFVIYGVFVKIYVYQWITMLICFTLLPIIPLVIVGFITVLLMNISHFTKNKDKLRMIGYIILLVVLMYFQYTLYSNIQVQDFSQLAQNSSYFLDKFSNYYPIIKLIDFAINGNILYAILGTLALLIISVGLVILFAIFLEKVFFKSYLKEQSRPIKKRNVKNKVKYKGVRPVSLAIAKIDFITLLKVPIYAFNTFSMIIIMPLVFIFSFSFSGIQEVAPLLIFYNFYYKEIWLGITLFLAISVSLIPITCTSFSREGRTNWIMRTLPISSKEHIFGRIIVPLLTQVVYSLVVLTIILFYLTKIGVEFSLVIDKALFALILSIVLSIPLLMIGLYIDLKLPKLKWENPQQAMKQNMNVLIHMGIGVVYATILVLSYIFIINLLVENMLITNLIYLLLGLTLSFISYKFLEKDFTNNLIIMEN
ncbi:MAG TPA: hypothetical protein VIK84_06890 [Haloplasmataceae bacterium]